MYEVRLRDECLVARSHVQLETLPTIEQLSAAENDALPALAKTLIFSSDDAPEIAADLEGMAILSPNELLLVNDNDFGVDGARTEIALVPGKR